MMMRSRRSKRVSWATGANLCKVRLFLSEDSPSQAGLRPQNNLQAKGSWLLHAAGPTSDDSLPPGFESLQPTNDLKIDISQIPLIRWKCPPSILLDENWCVVAGDESKEAAAQTERIFGALEAIYPRPSNIPPNPFVSPDVKDSHFDDSGTPLVPLIPVEDDDASDQREAPPVDIPNNYHQREIPVTTTQQHPCGSNGAISAGFSVEPDVAAAASAAFTAMMQANQKGSMVDQDLLIKILNDPEQVRRLMIEYTTIRHEQPPASSSVVAPTLPGPPPQMTARAGTSFSDHTATFRSTNPVLPPPPPPPPPMMNQLPSTAPPVTMNPQPIPSTGPATNFANAPGRSFDFYKTLIHQHGGERHEPLEQHRMQPGMYQQSAQTGGIDTVPMVNRENKVRGMKPCAYFNSPRGCRNGASCTFLHDASAPARKEQPKGSKRIKLDSRIAGRN